MTPKLSDLRVRVETPGDGRPIVGHYPVPLAELLAMLEAEGVLRQEVHSRVKKRNGVAIGTTVRIRYVTDWLPREESNE